MRLYECGVRFDKTMQNGTVKKVTELYLIDALSFTEAETRVIEQIKPFVSGELDVVSIKRTKYCDVAYDKFNIASHADGQVQKLTGSNAHASEVADKWFKVKLNHITIDEKTKAEKKSATYLIVNAGSNKAAHETVVNYMRDSVADYEIDTVSETKIMDVYLYSSDGSQSVGVKETNSQQTIENIFDTNSRVKRAAKKFVDALPEGTVVSASCSNPDGSMTTAEVMVDTSKPRADDD